MTGAARPGRVPVDGSIESLKSCFGGNEVPSGGSFEGVRLRMGGPDRVPGVGPPMSALIGFSLGSKSRV